MTAKIQLIRNVRKFNIELKSENFQMMNIP